MLGTKVIIFDLDDTLISENEYIYSGYQHISNILSEKLKENQNNIYNKLLKLFHESPQNVFNRLLDMYNVTYTKEVILNLVEEYRNHSPKITFFEDVLPCLELLKTKNIKTGIITDGYANAQRQKLKSVKASDYFEKIIVTDELGGEYWKPHPKSFEIMKESFGVEYEEMIYVGDNPKKDFYIGALYPIRTIRIRRDQGVYLDTKYYKNIRETISVSSLNDIIELLNN